MADAIVVLATVYYTYGAVKASRDANVRASFASALLHAGTATFASVICACLDVAIFQAYYISGKLQPVSRHITFSNI